MAGEVEPVHNFVCAIGVGRYDEHYMDILAEYEKQNQKPIQASPQRQPTDEYGFFIRLVMRLSGGKIENIRQASYVLLAAAGLVMITAIVVFLWTSRFFTSTKLLPPADPLRSPNSAGQQRQN